MKYILMFSIALALSACSSGDDTVGQDDKILPGALTLGINGTEKVIDANSLIGYEAGEIIDISNTNLQVQINGDQLDGFFIRFNKDGRLGRFSITYNQFGQPREFSNFRNLNSNYFDFDILNLDESKKRIKIAISGYVYANPDDMTSESKFVNGTIEVSYRAAVQPISGLGNSAIINGEPWNSVDEYLVRGDESGILNDYALNTISNDAYKITVCIRRDLVVEGTYNYPNDYYMKMRLYKFNPTTMVNTLYNCTGTMEVLEKWPTFIKGTYSFSAVNPNDPTDIIQVTDGAFKLSFPRS